MIALRPEMVVDRRGKPRKVILPWSQYQELVKILGLDLDSRTQSDLRAVRRDLEQRKLSAFRPLSSF